MKNVQVIDGAINSTFDFYRIPEHLFAIMFPSGRDVAFLHEVQGAFEEAGEADPWSVIYREKVDKKTVDGIHGTLHMTGSPCIPDYIPDHRESETSRNLPY